MGHEKIEALELSLYEDYLEELEKNTMEASVSYTHLTLPTIYSV